MADGDKIPAVKTAFSKNDKVMFRVPYVQRSIEKVRTFSERKWNLKEKNREAPNEKKTIANLRALFGESLVIDPVLILCLCKRKVSASPLSIIINALRLYYSEIFDKNFIYELKRLKKGRKLLVILSKGEVTKILSGLDNTKHKAIWY